jgi:hypothetical protein
VEEVYNKTVRDTYTNPDKWTLHGFPKKQASQEAYDLSTATGTKKSERARRSRKSVDGSCGLVPLEHELHMVAKEQINNSWMSARLAVLIVLSGLLTSPADDDTSTLLGVQVGVIPWDTASSTFPTGGKTKAGGKKKAGNRPSMHPAQIEFWKQDWRIFDARKGDKIQWSSADEVTDAPPRVWLADDAAARSKGIIVGPLYTWVIIKVCVSVRVEAVYSQVCRRAGAVKRVGTYIDNFHHCRCCRLGGTLAIGRGHTFRLMPTRKRQGMYCGAY